MATNPVENTTKLGGHDTHKSERKTRVRHSIANSKHTTDLWKELKICGSKHLVEPDHLAEEPATFEEDTFKEDLCCRACHVKFDNVTDYRPHFRDDWHRFNIKQKLRGKPPLTEEEFSNIEDGISSISGSDSEEDSKVNTPQVGSPKVVFKNAMGQQMAIYKCLLHQKKKPPKSDEELLDLIYQLPSRNKWAVVMLGGGHFASAIYSGADLILHKTFHSYTVRAKQGGSQSSRDNKSGGGSHPKSAGASLRRYNEAAFAEHIHETLELWKNALKECHLILYRAASSNQTILFGGKNPVFDRSDSRVRSIPFPTRRATLKEVQRVWLCLSSIELLDECDAEVQDTAGMEKLAINESFVVEDQTSSDSEKIDEINLKLPRRGKKKPKDKESPNMDACQLGLFPGEKELMESIAEAVTEGNAAAFEQRLGNLADILVSYFEDYHLDLTDVLNQRLDQDCLTLLHKAAALRRANITWKLLESGCDPSLPDALGRVPYVLAVDKETRNTFRRFMGLYPDRYDYAKALIPSPLTDDIERQKQERLAEKRKQQKQTRKEKKQQEKIKLEEQKRIDEERRKVEEERKQIEEEKNRFLQLSDREKRALAAERRLLNNLSAAGAATPVLVRCFLCAEDMSGKVPFEYNGYKFCTTQCLQKHRKLNPVRL